MSGFVRAAGVLVVCSLLGACSAITGDDPAGPQRPAADVCWTDEDEADSSVPDGDNPFTWTCEAGERQGMSLALHWFRNSAEYRATALQAYRMARGELATLTRGAANGTWYVIMDADETILDNSAYQQEREACGLEFTSATWCEWSRASAAAALPGAVEFTHWVHERGGFVVIVTNRELREEAWTRAVLRRLGVAYDGLMLREGESNKAERWRRSRHLVAGLPGAANPVPVMWIGDQVSDLPLFDARGAIVGAMSQEPPDGREPVLPEGVRFVLVPNPVYGGWTKNPAN